MNDKAQKIKDYIEQAGLEATIENQATVIKARDIEIAELKVQVNGLRRLLVGALNNSNNDWLFEMASTIEEVLNETPEQCLANYHNAIIDICVEATKHAQGNAKFFAEIVQGLKK